MLTVSDIDNLTNSHDGCIYSDMYKSVYGYRPRGHEFRDLEDFDREMECLSKQVSIHLDEERIRQAANLENFAQRVMDTMELCNCDQRRAVEIIADAEGELEDYNWYGPESLENYFNLKYGSIKQAIFGEF